MILEKVKLGELYTVHNGLSKGSKFFGSGYPFLSFSTIFNNYFVPDKLCDLVQSDEKEQNNYSIKRGDVFVTRTSETSDELGMSCVALKDYPRATYNGFTKRMRPIVTDRVLPEYIGYYMRMPSFRGEFQAFSTMTTRASLKNEDLLRLTVALPPMEQQIKIAEILRTYDKLIENNKKQINLLEEAAQRLYKEWFVDLRFLGYEGTEIVDGIPNGWTETTIDSFIELQSGYAFKSSSFDEAGNYKIVTIKNVQDGVFDGDNVNKIVDVPDKMPSHCKLQEGESLLSLTGNVGRVCTVVGDNYLLNQRVAKIASDYPYFSYCLFRSEKMFHDMNNLANGAAQQNLSPIRTGKMKVIKPDNKVLLKFEQIVKSIFDKKIVLNRDILVATQARDRLLPKLMNGEIEV